MTIRTLPAGTLTTAVVDNATIQHLATDATASTITVPDGSPAATMSRDTLAYLLEFKLLSGSGWPTSVAQTPANLAIYIAKNEREPFPHLAQLLATRQTDSKASISAQIDAAEPMAVAMAQGFGTTQAAVLETAYVWRMYVSEWWRKSPFVKAKQL